jgi:hypothetical protein
MSQNKHLAALARQQTRHDLTRSLWARRLPATRRMFWRDLAAKWAEIEHKTQHTTAGDAGRR